MNLKVYNIWTRFEGDPYEVDQIKQSLSILDPKRFFSKLYKKKVWSDSKQQMVRCWDGYHRFYSDVKQIFPSGLVNFVLARCEKLGIDVNYYDLRGVPQAPPSHVPSYDLTDFQPRDYQKQASRLAVKQGRAIIHAATNAGKTEIAAMIIQYLGLETLYLVHTNELMIQTKQRFEERGIQGVGIIGGGQHDPRRVNICMIQTLYRYRSTPEVRELLRSAQVLFIDECQHLAAQSYYKLVMACGAYYRYGLSGTPFKKDIFSDMRLLGATGSVLPLQISNELLIKEGHSAIPYIVALDIPTTFVLSNPKTYAAVYKAYIMENEGRNRTIVRASETLVGQGRKVLVIVRQIAHGEALLKMFQEQNQVLAEFVSGESGYEVRGEILDRFKKGMVDVLISSTIFDEGVDVPQIDAVVLGVGERSPIKLLQRMGRGLRKKEHNYLTIVDLNDQDHRYISKHTQERLSIYQQEGFKVYQGQHAEEVLSNVKAVETEELIEDGS